MNPEPMEYSRIRVSAPHGRDAGWFAIFSYRSVLFDEIPQQENLAMHVSCVSIFWNVLLSSFKFFAGLFSHSGANDLRCGSFCF